MNKEERPLVVAFRDEYAPYFEALNREWIESYFAVEEADLAVFADPRGTVIEPGGQIFFVLEGGRVLGTCAVLRHGAGSFELAKMAVSPRARGRGFGDLLLRAAVEFAREAGADRLVLLSNSRLAPALSLYEKHGFRRVPLEGDHGYSRVDVRMELDLR